MLSQAAILLAASMCLLSMTGFADKGSNAVKNPEVLLKTNKGDIKIRLDAEKAPKSVENFLQYVNEGFYNGTIFHRVIPGFMVQGGGFDKEMNQKKTHAPITNEAANGLQNKVGTLAMARTNDINSATAQFFINVVDNSFLDHKGPSSYGYAVFGQVIDGLDIVKGIEKVKTGSKGGYQDVPVEPVLIEKAEVIKG
ncbi:MAG: peptidylprolyl isomerase [Chlamydiales bacterium]|nr:peptidylprolyl isomerase [Chlamydiales bacterium]